MLPLSRLRSRLALTVTAVAVLSAGVQSPAPATPVRSPVRSLAGTGAAAGEQTGNWPGHPDRRIVRHTVRRGESASGLARHYHAWTRELRALNGLDARGTIRAGQTLRIPVVVSAARRAALRASLRATAGRAGTARNAAYVPKGIGTPTRNPRLMKQRGWRNWQLSRADVRRIIVAKAKRYGVPPEVALAVAWQESGWQQPMRSSAGALGVMQVMPATGTWMEQYVGRDLNLRGTYDNITAGVILLHVLRKQTNGRNAIAAYYQGLKAVRKHGFFGETELYVASVLAIQRRISKGWNPAAA